MIDIKEEKAVTLTAVIIAIILIIILASVTLYFAIGDNGIISKSKQAVSAYKEQSIRERVELKLADWSIELLENNQSATIDNIIELANKDEEIDSAIQNVNNILLVIDGEYQCEINTNLEIVGNITVYDPETAIQRATTTLQYCTVER